MNENAAVLGLLDTLEHEIVPALERAPIEMNWVRAHRVVEALILLVPNARAALSLTPSRFGVPEGGLAARKRHERLPILMLFIDEVKKALGVTSGKRVTFLPAPLEPPRPKVKGSHIPPAPARLPALDELPKWMPENRVLGAFRIDGPIGHGATGSVFVAHRLGDEDERAPESFAVKVPLASGDVSEERFLAWFREEAQAIVSLPKHKNVAHVVAFDLAAKPKPILVMEHVHGKNLEEEIDGGLDTGRALRILSDVAAGLECMHSASIAHLDVKPSNVVLREGTGSAVLVDFGLAGRHLRPGCGSPAYGAPEVWMATEGGVPAPFAADIYAFGCVVFEVLTGRILFMPEDEDPRSQVRMHLLHDGLPRGVVELLSRPELTELGALVSRMVDPRHEARPTIEVVRAELARMEDQLRRAPWPLLPRARTRSTVEATTLGRSASVVEIEVG